MVSLLKKYVVLELSDGKKALLVGSDPLDEHFVLAARSGMTYVIDVTVGLPWLVTRVDLQPLRDAVERLAQAEAFPYQQAAA